MACCLEQIERKYQIAHKFRTRFTKKTNAYVAITCQQAHSLFLLASVQRGWQSPDEMMCKENLRTVTSPSPTQGTAITCERNKCVPLLCSPTRALGCVPSLIRCPNLQEWLDKRAGLCWKADLCWTCQTLFSTSSVAH